jgi:hypothetical protein
MDLRPDPVHSEKFTIQDAAKACQVAHHLALAGRLVAAEEILYVVLKHFSNYLDAVHLLGKIKERMRDFPGAIAAYELATEISPGNAEPFTRRALLKFRLHFGSPQPARAANLAHSFIVMPTLGVNGRFGNQLLQYGILRLYAERIGAQTLVPDWIGRDLFAHCDPVIGGVKPIGKIDECGVIDILAGRTNTFQSNIEVCGYFCGNTSDWASGKGAFQKLFEPIPKVCSHVNAALRQLHMFGSTLVVLHLRRGDYGYGPFWIAPTSWYKTWLEQVWPELDLPVLYIATDDAKLALEFSRYKPFLSSDLIDSLPGVEFFCDHWIMRHADILATSNSTFSGTAALLNKKPAAKFLRPDLIQNGLRPYDPWAEKILLS